VWQHGYPGWFGYAPTTTPLSNPASKSILIPEQAPDPTQEGYGQSFSGVNLTSQIGEVRVKHDFNSNWHLVVGALHQIADRNINTAVNSLTDNTGDYKSYDANAFSPLAPQFQVVSDVAYVTGQLHTGKIRHDISFGTAGYRFASWSPVTSPAKTPLCTAQNVCQTNIADPVDDVIPPGGLFSYTKTSPSTGIYVSSIIHQQGFSLSDEIMLASKWFLRVGASQDWTWVTTYGDSAATGYLKTPGLGGYTSQGVSPTGSIGFKPRADMTIYASFVDSIQAPDVAAVSTPPTTFITNASQPLPQYRSKEGEIGYKLRIRRINFSTALFRLDRPFPNYVTNVVNPAACGSQSGTVNCETYEISGDQRNYGIETMISGRIVESLMISGGLTVLNPRLTDTGIAATNDRNFVGIPDFKSNILAEYHVPVLTSTFFTFDWQHVGRRAIDDINSEYTPQYNTFDFGVRYTAKVFGKLTAWRITANNATNLHYWSTLGPGSITGASTGSYLAHLGDPLLITASMRFNF
jgi:iron complex outermembrane receptor protein